mmetsp:Transcript_38706/g.89692  ORF Transcript_38706/g.89692 Transcript_38706/m.89692 type:complete len:339 (+) Transcript_38706:1624-2640(+)
MTTSPSGPTVSGAPVGVQVKAGRRTIRMATGRSRSRMKVGRVRTPAKIGRTTRTLLGRRVIPTTTGRSKTHGRRAATHGTRTTGLLHGTRRTGVLKVGTAQRHQVGTHAAEIGGHRRAAVGNPRGPSGGRSRTTGGSLTGKGARWLQPLEHKTRRGCRKWCPRHHLPWRSAPPLPRGTAKAGGRTGRSTLTPPTASLQRSEVVGLMPVCRHHHPGKHLQRLRRPFQPACLHQRQPACLPGRPTQCLHLRGPLRRRPQQLGPQQPRCPPEYLRPPGRWWPPQLQHLLCRRPPGQEATKLMRQQNFQVWVRQQSQEEERLGMMTRGAPTWRVSVAHHYRR